MKQLWVIIGALFLFSCQNVEETKRPEKLIPEQKMVEVLTDLSLLNSAKNYNKRQLEETGLRPQEYLYEKHAIDSIRLAESTMFYAQNPDQLERIYSKVRSNLEILKRDLENIKEEETRIEDSINALKNEADSLNLQPEELKARRDSLRAAADTASSNGGDSLRIQPEEIRTRRLDSLGTSPNRRRG